MKVRFLGFPLPVFLFFFISVFSLSGEVVISEVSTYPAEFYVGDIVEMRIHLRFSEPVKLIAPVDFPSSDWLRIDSVKVTQGERDAVVFIVFRSYAVGSGIIPALDLGSYTLDGIKIATDSLVKRNLRNLVSPREQAVFPGTQIYMILFFMLLLAVPFLGFFFIRSFIKWIQALVVFYKLKRPFMKFSHSLKKLRGTTSEPDVKKFYTQLTTSLKVYLDQKFEDFDFISATSKEISQRINKISEIDRDMQSRLMSLFRKSDMVKFADEKASLKEREEDLAMAVRIGDILEERDSHANV